MCEEPEPAWQPGFFGDAGTDGLRIPARLLDHAVVAHTRVGGLHVSYVGRDVALEVDDYTVVLCDGGAFHYFHLMESLVWLWAVQHEFLGGRPPTRVVLSIAWDDPRQYGIGRAVMAALYPAVELLDPNSPCWPRRLDRVLIIHRSWAQMRLNKYLEAAMGFATPHVRGMATVVRRALQAHEGPRRLSNVLYVTRPPPRCLAADQEANLVYALRRLGGCSVIDFAALPWAQQVRQAAAHDVIVSVHGNGLTNALWMRPGSLLIELFPPGMRALDYQFTAELCGLHYVGIAGGRTFVNGDRTPQFGDAHTSASPVPEVNAAQIQALIQALRTHR